MIANADHWALFVSFYEKELRGRYTDTVGGAAWALLQPLFLLGIYAFVFRTIFQVRFPELGQHNFIEFVAVALWPWLAFQEGVQRGAQAVRANASLIRKVEFPNELLVYAAVAATYSLHMIGFVIVSVVLAAFGAVFHLAMVPLVLLLMVILLVFTLAIALLCAAAQVFLPDTEQFLGPVLSVLFYATPILYPLTLVPPELAAAMAVNPLAAFVEPLRSALLWGTPSFGWLQITVYLGSVLLLVLAVRAFRRMTPYFEDFL